MPEADRQRWNQRYCQEGPMDCQPHPFLVEMFSRLGPPGRALDVAGGAGRHALWLAQRTWQVTLADISDVALRMAQQAAQECNVPVRWLSAAQAAPPSPLPCPGEPPPEKASARSGSLLLVEHDLEERGLPEGQWDLVLNIYYLHRPLFVQMASRLVPGGHLLVVHPTRKNLQRHARPPERFLLDEGELPSLLAGLEILSHEERWFENGRHEARLLARRGSPPVPQKRKT